MVVGNTVLINIKAVDEYTLFGWKNVKKKNDKEDDVELGF